MTLRRQKLALWLLGIGLVLGGVLVVAWGFRGKCSVVLSQSSTGSARAAKAPTTNPQAPLSLKEFEPHWNKPLRRPIFDPPPVVIPPPKKEVPPPLNVRLVGTIIEPGETVAMLANARNSLEFKKVGDSWGAGKLLATITAIENSRVTIQYAGETIVLTMQDGGRR